MDRLLANSFWDGPLARFAKATGLVVSLYDKDLELHSGPHAMGPIAERFAKAGFWNGNTGTKFEQETAAACMKSGTTIASTFLGALGLCATPAIGSGEVIGAFVLGWVPDHFIDPVVSRRIADAVGIHEMEAWQVLRTQTPMTQEKMLLYVEMLQNFAEALLRELETKEKYEAKAQTLRIVAASAIDVSAAKTAQEIYTSIAQAITKMIPGAGVSVTVHGIGVLNEVEPSLSADDDLEIRAEHSLKVAIKSSAQQRLGSIDITLPPGYGKADLSAELSTLAAQAAVALQKTQLIADLGDERNALDKVNAELRHLHRMKDEFLATISHELRTPLNSMLGWSQMLRDDYLDPEEWKEAIEAIERNAKVQAKLIEDLLDISRIISGKMVMERHVVDLNEVLKQSIETVMPMAESKGLTLETDIPEGPLPIRGDATRLQQAFWNIISNATKFTPEGGRISVSLKQNGGYAVITIKDNGKGIPNEFIPYLFDRFSQADGSHTRQHGGLGLGLAIVRHVAELHGGSVKAESDGEGLGASFIVTLPMNITDAELESAMNLIRDLDFGADGGRRQLLGLKVLAVDDEPDSLRLVKFILEKSGAIVNAVEDAARAYHEVRKWHPDLIVSDISMPGEDGFQLMRRIRELPMSEGGATPAFALTSHADSDHKEKAFNAGYQRYFSKPLDAKALLTSVKEFSALH